MSLGILLKLFGDICLYFGILSGLPSLFSFAYSFLWPAALCGCGGALAAFFQQQGKGRYRFLAMLLPLSTLILARSVIEALILLPCIVYACAVILRDDYDMDYYGFREVYIRALVALGIYCVAVWGLSSMETINNQTRNTMDPEAVLICGVCYAFVGIVLLRHLRMGEDRGGQRMGWVQLTVMLLCIGLAAVGLMVLERTLQEHSTSVLEIIWNCIAAILSLPFLVFSWLSKVKMDDTDYTMPTETTSTQPTEPTVVIQPQETIAEESAQSAAQMGFPWWLAVLILAVVLVILMQMLRGLRRRTVTVTSRETVERIPPSQREKPAPRRSNRSKVRRAYREFLKNEKRKGRKIHTDQTSEDLLTGLAYGTDPKGAARLREVYIQARYDDVRNVTQEQVEQAKSALKQYKGS